MTIELRHLVAIFRKTPAATLEGFVAPLNDIFARREFTLDQPVFQAHFIAQAGHETMGFTAMRENLNYDAAGLLRVFGKYFTAQEAIAYSRQPERIANRVYASRMGNGNEASGDGWLFRGGGIPHTTGRNHYAELSLAIVKDRNTLLQNPELIADPDYAVLSGAWYWSMNELWRHAARGDVDAVSDLINIGRQTEKVGDSNGFDDRKRLTERALQVLGA